MTYCVPQSYAPEKSPLKDIGISIWNLITKSDWKFAGIGYSFSETLTPFVMEVPVTSKDPVF